MNFIILLTTSSKLLTEKFRGDDDGEKLIEFFDEIFFIILENEKFLALNFLQYFPSIASAINLHIECPLKWRAMSG
jgi:hypothetical protein